MSSNSANGVAKALATPVQSPIPSARPRCIFDNCPWSYGYPMDDERRRHICFIHLLNANFGPKLEDEITGRGAVALQPDQVTGDGSRPRQLP